MIFQEAFWDEDKDVICVAHSGSSSRDMSQESFKNQRGMLCVFWNCTKQVGRPCLMGLMTGDAALTLETDDLIIEEAVRILTRIYQRSSFKIVESYVTRWQMDPYSRGSYSFVGLEASGADYDLLARPINNTVFFGGEATCRTHPGTVHGAYISGLRVANEVLTSVIGDIAIPNPLIPTRDSNRNGHGGSAPPVLNPGPSQGLRVRSVTPHQVISEYRSPDPVSSGAESSDLKRKKSITDLADPTVRLEKLKQSRIQEDNDRMRKALVADLGARPVKPERTGANPFLLFQKDFWEKCRDACNAKKQKQTGDPTARAARDEVRVALGKMWRDLPDQEKEPYLTATKKLKEHNTKKSDEYREMTRRYEAEVEAFKIRWKQENASKPSEEEIKLTRLIAEHKKMRNYR